MKAPCRGIATIAVGMYVCMYAYSCTQDAPKKVQRMFERVTSDVLAQVPPSSLFLLQAIPFLTCAGLHVHVCTCTYSTY